MARKVNLWADKLLSVFWDDFEESFLLWKSLVCLVIMAALTLFKPAVIGGLFYCADLLTQKTKGFLPQF